MAAPRSRGAQLAPVITADELARMAGEPDVVIVDCRFSLADSEAGRAAYRSGHIPGAVYAHLNDDLSAPVVPGKTGRHPWPDPDAMVERLEKWGVRNSSHVIAYDDSGGAIAARLWFLLLWLGHDAVQVLDGGYGAWLRDRHPVSTAAPSMKRVGFEPNVRPQLIVDADAVDHARSQPSYRLFDARAPARFRGDEDPIDPVAGHIPSARSLPFADNLEEGGRFHSPAALHARFLQALGNVPPEQAVVYCGSGVTACHDILAAAHAGLEGMRLYPGSWSEWITDPGRPIARGDE